MTENCTERSEFCEAFHRMQVFHSETVFCEQKYEVDCSDNSVRNVTSTPSEADNINNVVENSTETETVTAKPLPIVASLDDVEEESGETCYPKRMAVCRTVPQRVTITERKQKCNGEDDYRTTKMCTTREDGSGG